MTDKRLIYRAIKNFEIFIDKNKVTSTQVCEAINACRIPQWLKTGLIWLSAWKLKQRGYFSFLRAYLTLAGAMLITRPSIWTLIVRLFFDESDRVGQVLLAIVEFFNGIFSISVFWIITAIVCLVVTFHFIIQFQESRVAKQIVSLSNDISFNPEEGWFDKKCNLAITKLGGRYSSNINFRNVRLNSVYKALTKPDYWDKGFKKVLQSFVRESRHLCKSLPENVNTQKKRIDDWIDGIIEIYNNRRYDSFALIFKNAEAIDGEFNNLTYSRLGIVERYQYKKIDETIRKLKDYEAMCQFVSSPVLYIKGEAGTGKSHLLADIVRLRMERRMKSMLALGLDFNGNKDVKERMLDIWQVKGTWDDFLKKLDKIGELEKYRILIFLDGINEGLGNQLWPSAIGELEADILQYKHLGLVVSARSFAKTNILDNVSQGKATITLEGFKGMEDEAIAYLTGKFGVTLPNISKYKKEFSNPLFLKLYCKAYSSTSHPVPDSFLDVAENYISKVNEKLSEKYGYQSTLFNYAQQVSDALTEMFVEQSEARMVKYQRLDDLLKRTNAILPLGISCHDFVQDLISEGVFMSYVDDKNDVLVDFNFDLVGDYLYAAALIKHNWKTYFGRVYDEGIYEATSVLLPILKGVEIINYQETNIDQDYREFLFVETLKHRFSISPEAIKEIERIKSIDIETFYEILPILTSHPECSVVINDVNNQLKAMSIVERDRKWSMYFTIVCKNPSQTELVNLSSWAASLGRESARTMLDRVSYQMVCVMCWGFTSPYRPLRDLATKGAINLLRDKPIVLIQILDLFDDVNDPYVQQRLYAVVHGCVFRGKCGQSQLLGRKIYDKVFKNDPIRTDILLRDYARCAIDFISRTAALPGVDMKRIEPPYGVPFSFSICPDRKTVEQKYRINNKMGYSKAAVNTQEKILESMETEYSNGTGGYGDFGRYVFEAAMRNWAKCKGYNASLLRNYALDIIFAKYGFDAAVYAEHDDGSSSGRSSRPMMERFGKKFQWIAMYEVLGLMQDNYPMESWRSNRNSIQCKGTWDPLVRDIDTTNGFWNYNEDDYSLLKDEELEWLHVDVLPFRVKNQKNWLRSKEGLCKEVVKSSIEVKDENGDSWIVLYGQNTMTPADESLVLDDTEMSLWEFVQAYTVPRKQRNAVAKFINREGTQGRQMPEMANSVYELFYKDYYSSASYRDYAERTGLDKWTDFGNGLSYRISYLPYSSGEKLSLIRLNKQLFDMLGLKDGEREGDYVDATGRLIAYDPSVRFNNDGQLVVRKEELVSALKKNQITLVWPILMEKQVGASTAGYQMGGSAYLTERGKIKARLRLYKDKTVGTKWNVRHQKLKNYVDLFWYTVTFNKAKKVRTRMKMKIAKMQHERYNS